MEITSIRELRLGQAPTEAYDGARWITIVYVRDKQWKVVHFIARTDDVYALWVRALQNLVSASSDKVVSGTQVASDSDPELRFIRQVWPAGTKAIDKATTASICAQLGLVVPPPIVAKYEVRVTRRLRCTPHEEALRLCLDQRATSLVIGRIALVARCHELTRSSHSI